MATLPATSHNPYILFSAILHLQKSSLFSLTSAICHPVPSSDAAFKIHFFLLQWSSTFPVVWTGSDRRTQNAVKSEKIRMCYTNWNTSTLICVIVWHTSGHTHLLCETVLQEEYCLLLHSTDYTSRYTANLTSLWIHLFFAVWLCTTDSPYLGGRIVRWTT